MPTDAVSTYVYIGADKFLQLDRMFARLDTAA